MAKTKNYIPFKKTYVKDSNGATYAPYEIWVYYQGFDKVLDNKLIELAKRNSGVEAGSGSNGYHRDISFEFFNKKGIKQFMNKVSTRYPEVDITLKELMFDYEEISPTDL